MQEIFDRLAVFAQDHAKAKLGGLDTFEVEERRWISKGRYYQVRTAAAFGGRERHELLRYAPQ